MRQPHIAITTLLLAIASCGQSEIPLSTVVTEAPGVSIPPRAAEMERIEPSTPAAKPVEARRPRLSERAQRVSDLIDEGKLEAAQAVLDPWLTTYASDAGLRLQELRLRLRTWDFVSYSEQYDNVSPLMRMARTVAQLDESLASTVADEIFRQLQLDMSACVRNGTTIMALHEWIYFGRLDVSPKFPNEMNTLIGPRDAADLGASAESQPLESLALVALPLGAMTLRMQHGTSCVSGGWARLVDVACEVDPRSHERWRDAMRGLPDAFAGQGMYNSALFVIEAEGRMSSNFDYYGRAIEVLTDALDGSSADPNQRIRMAVALLTYSESNIERARRLWSDKDARFVRLVGQLEGSMNRATADAFRAHLGIR
jgi:hypothetical protein